MGVKAVWGRSREPVMCFGTRGKTDKGRLSQAHSTAKRALEQPYFITIGGGEQVPEALRGRLIELVRGTGVYGETNAFVSDPEMRVRLEQWPVAIVISEVYSINGEPLLIEDLGFADRSILANAYDSVIRNDEQIEALWAALADRTVTRRWEIPLPPSFRDPGKVQLFGSRYPKLKYSSGEGRKVWKLQLSAERDQKLRREAKRLNRENNGGVPCCEACDFSDDKDSMFDAHHLRPISAGERESRVDDLAILCPTCHRWAHAKCEDRLDPLAIDEIRRQRAAD